MKKKTDKELYPYGIVYYRISEKPTKKILWFNRKQRYIVDRVNARSGTLLLRYTFKGIKAVNSYLKGHPDKTVVYEYHKD